MSGREPTSASFEPERLTPKRRRVDPVVVVAVVVTLGIGAAIAKPWGGTETDPTALASPSAAIAAAATTAPSAAPLPTQAAGAAEAPARVSTPDIGWPRAAAAITSQDAWGVRAVVLDPALAAGLDDDAIAATATGLVERWSPVVAAADEPVLLATADQGVLALGVTFPPDELPLDARIYAAADDGGWTWRDARPLDGAPATGTLLFGPPVVDGVTLPTWPTGAYRFELLLGTATRIIDVDLPDRFEVVPPPDPAADRPSGPSPFSPEFRLRSTDRAFVIQDGAAVPLIGGPSGPMELATAWADAGPTGRGRALDQVPSIYAPRATGLGVMLPTAASAHTATITALAPVARDPGSRRALGIRFWEGGRSPYVIFRAPRAGIWPAGVYRMDVAWTEDGERQTAAYHVELRPGPGGEVPSTLSALRALAPSAGRDAVVGHEGGLGMVQDLTCGRDAAGDPLADPPVAIGVGYPPGDAPSSVAMALQLDGGRVANQPVLIAPDAVPGLAIVVPATGAAFPRGVYRLTIGEGAGAEVRTICAGAVAPG